MGYTPDATPLPAGKNLRHPRCPRAGRGPVSYLRRHHCGDWGEELCAEDKQANEDALVYGTRLLSCYRTPAGDRLYIITEHDRIDDRRSCSPRNTDPPPFNPHANAPVPRLTVRLTHADGGCEGRSYCHTLCGGACPPTADNAAFGRLRISRPFQAGLTPVQSACQRTSRTQNGLKIWCEPACGWCATNDGAVRQVGGCRNAQPSGTITP